MDYLGRFSLGIEKRNTKVRAVCSSAVMDVSCVGAVLQNTHDTITENAAIKYMYREADGSKWGYLARFRGSADWNGVVAEAVATWRYKGDSKSPGGLRISNSIDKRKVYLPWRRLAKVFYRSIFYLSILLYIYMRVFDLAFAGIMPEHLELQHLLDGDIECQTVPS